MQALWAAILAFLMDGLTAIYQAYIRRGRNRKENSRLKTNLKKAKTREEQKRATSDLARSIGRKRK